MEEDEETGKSDLHQPQSPSSLQMKAAVEDVAGISPAAFNTDYKVKTAWNWCGGKELMGKVYSNLYSFRNTTFLDLLSGFVLGILMSGFSGVFAGTIFDAADIDAYVDIAFLLFFNLFMGIL